MVNLKSFLAGVVFSAIVAAIIVEASSAQDPVEVSPDLYEVLLDNDQVRILEVTYPPCVRLVVASPMGCDKL